MADAIRKLRWRS